MPVLLLYLLIANAVVPTKETVFACHIDDRITTIVREGSRLIYHSVRRGALELQVGDGRYAQEGFSGGGELQAIFRNGPWTYVVYERTIRTRFRGTHDPRFEAGVDVLRGGRVISRRGCADEDTQFTKPLAGTLEGTFVEH